MTPFLPLLMLWCVAAWPADALTKGGSDEWLQREMVQRVNAVRARGCRCGETALAPAPALTWDERLEQAARRHARDLAQHRLVQHTGTDGSTTSERIRESGFSFRLIGENIAYGHRSPEEVITHWLSSPGHCRNIMNPAYHQMGGAFESGFWVQTLALPE